jgi:hypothetical protein
MNHYLNDSSTNEWRLMCASLSRDDGHSFQLVNGRWVIDGVASVDTYRSAADLAA